MITTQSQASKRLFKKLSALRATLSNEEREILDNLIVVEEVSGHKMLSKTVAKNVAKNTAKSAEVAAHKMMSKTVAKNVAKNTAKSAEVAAHRMTSKTVAKNVAKNTAKTTFRIAFDPNSEEYKIQD